jgi:hypothetical protein
MLIVYFILFGLTLCGVIYIVGSAAAWIANRFGDLVAAVFVVVVIFGLLGGIAQLMANSNRHQQEAVATSVTSETD